MEITKIKIAGCEAYMIFTGSHYIFLSDWYGVFGLATRKGDNEADVHTFIIKAGTELTQSGSVNRSSIITAMKRRISKSEDLRMPWTTSFEDSGEICNCQIEFQLIEQTK